MFLSSIVALAFIVLRCDANENKDAFDAFIEKYSFNYTGEEYNRRFGIFTANLKRIEAAAHNDNVKGDFGINRFADVDPDEFAQQYLLPSDLESKVAHKNRTGLDAPPASRAKRQTLPTSYDFRAYGWVTAVKNQGQCGSCWAHAAVAGMEVVHKRTWGYTNDFSEQMLVDCARPPNYGCDGGWTDYALDYVINNGMAFESAYPYRAVDQSCASAARPIKGVKYFYVGAEADIPYHIYHFGPIAFYFRVPASFQWYTGGVFDVADCSSHIGLHEMLIVGYTPSYWIVKNSWGTGWGDAGYVYYARGKNLCGIQNELICMYPA